MPTRRRFLTAAAALGIGSATAACTSSSSGGERPPDEDTLLLRIWDERARSPYEESVSAFTSATGIAVRVESQEWNEYWQALPLDVAGGTAADVAWMNTANLEQYLQSESLLDAGAAIGDAAGRWEPAATDLYRRDETLWGVPQTWDISMLAANRSLTDEAGVDPGALTYDPAADTDPLRDAARALTVDPGGLHPGDEGFDPAARERFGFSAHLDRTAVLGPFIAGQGGRWQDEDGTFAFASPEGIAAVQYLADLAGEHLAPAGTETVGDPDLCRDLFIDGRLGLLQTGSYDLAQLAGGIAGGFGWDLHPVVGGPQGSHPLVHAVAAVGIDGGDEDRNAAIGELLAWLGSVDGQRPLAAAGIGIPAHRELRGAFQEHWAGQGVDVTALGAEQDGTAAPETGVRSAEGAEAALPIFAEVFRGEATAEEAMPRAQEAAEATRA